MDPAPSYEASLARVVVTLVALALGAWWLMRRARGGTLHTHKGPIELLDRVVLDPRHTLYLVRVAGRTLLLGGGADQLSTLAALDDLPAETAFPARETTAPAHTAESVSGRPPA